MPSRAAFATCLALLISACGSSRYGHIYSPSGAAPGSVVFPDSAANRGQVQATLADGEHCSGRYATVPGPQVTWDDQEPSIIYEEDTQDGMAIFDCSGGHLVHCSLSRDLAGDGTGRCIDNHGQQLTLVF